MVHNEFQFTVYSLQLFVAKQYGDCQFSTLVLIDNYLDLD